MSLGERTGSGREVGRHLQVIDLFDDGVQGQCCVGRSVGAVHRFGVDVRSDRFGELIERCRHALSPIEGFDTEFVVATPQVLHERGPTNHDRHSPVGSQTAHWSQTCLESAVVVLDSVVRISRGAIHRVR